MDTQHLRAGLSIVMASKAALGAYEALYRAGQHEQVCLAVWCVIWDDFFRRYQDPIIFDPGVPAILGIFFDPAFNLELRLHDVGSPAAEQRLRIEPPPGVLVVVWALQILKPLFVRPIGPFSPRVTERATNEP